MKVTANLGQLVVLATLGVGLSACSSQDFLAARGEGRFFQSNVSEPQDSSDGQKVTDGVIEDESYFDEESPPVEVAGANLVGDCFFLEDGPADSTTGAIECVMSLGNSESNVVIVRSAQLHIGSPEVQPIEGTIFGLPGQKPDSFVVSDAQPLRLNFTFSRNEIAALSAEEIQISFNELFIGGKNPQSNRMVKMKVHKKKVSSQAKCDDIKLEPLAGSIQTVLGAPVLGVSVQRGAPDQQSQENILHFAIKDTPIDLGCDYALELAGNAFKDQNAKGYVAIVDKNTGRPTLLYWTGSLSNQGFPELTGEQLSHFSPGVKESPCRSRNLNDKGKWICSDYLNIFAADLNAGTKYFEVFGLPSGSLQLK
ncbi:MAG: hypothetical protein RJB13_1957 [Pseudomonadota bacterium]